jgi:subtilase family serine protease
MYQRDGVPPTSKWSVSHKAESYLTVTFTLALKQRNTLLLQQMLLENSDPASPKYGQHLTHKEVMELAAPTKKVQKKVINWLKDAATAYGTSNLIKITNHQDSIEVKATVAYVEQLFQTNIHVLINKKTNAAILKHIGPLSIPKKLLQYIELITGITELPPTDLPFLGKGVQKKTQENRKPFQDNQCNVPYNIKNLYSVDQTLVVTNPLANQSIYAEVSAGTEEGFGIGSVADWEQANNLPKVCVK